MIEIGFYKEDERAVIPSVAYSGTSACFDLIAIENIRIPARSWNMCTNGLRMAVPPGYYVQFFDRSGNGINKDLHIHMGIIDAGYSGPLSIKMYNFGHQDQIIEKGKGICQCGVFKIPEYKIKELSKEEWNNYCNSSPRGENGLGSSDSTPKEVKI